MAEIKAANPNKQVISTKDIVRCWLSHNRNEQRAERTLEGIFTALSNCAHDDVMNTMKEINNRGEDPSKAVSMSLLQHAVRKKHNCVCNTVTHDYIRLFAQVRLKGR